MNCKYTYPKKNFDKEDISFFYLFFDNGDYLTFDGKEIVDIKVNTYDKMLWGECGFYVFAESGYIKLLIKKVDAIRYQDCVLYDIDNYRKNRRIYIKNRCVKEGGIKYLGVFDNQLGHDNIYGNIVAELHGEFLILKFLNQPNFGSSDGDKNLILLNDIKIPVIESIRLEFYGVGRYITIDKNEISAIRLEFCDNLGRNRGSGELRRRVKGGYIKFKFDEGILHRDYELFTDGKPCVKLFEDMLCSEKDRSEHEIRWLYITYDYANFGACRNEYIEVRDMRLDEKSENLEKEAENLYDFIGGWCKKFYDGTIVIAFGKNAASLLKRNL